MVKYTSETNIAASFAFLLLLSFCSYVESYRNSYNPGRIVGGQPANITDFPYQLALEDIVGDLICGASIIDTSWAVTAAHCFALYLTNQLRVRSGTSYREGGTLHQIEKIIIHPSFRLHTFDYDVCVIKVSPPFHYSDVAQRIALAHNPPATGTPVVVSGWGSLKYRGPQATHLQQVTVYIEDYLKCKQTYQHIHLLTPRKLCAGVPQGGKDSCQGDSGGPLVFKNRLVGIVSWGQDCGQKEYPGVYTNVAEVHQWINTSILNN